MKVKQLHDVLDELAAKLTKDGKADDARGIACFTKLLNGQDDSTVAALARSLKARGLAVGA